jgi:hypothetical protein
MLLLLGLMAGCSSTTSAPTAPVITYSGPQTYFAGAVAGGYTGSTLSDSSNLATYTFDDTRNTFAQFTYAFSGTQEGPQMNYSGDVSALPRGFLNLGVIYSNGKYGLSYSGGGSTTYDPPRGSGQNCSPYCNWAVELPNEAGGLVNLQGMPFVPLVAAQACPSYSTASTFQFVTIPSYVGGPTGGGTIAPWNPQLDTAYGTVQIATTGDTVKFESIHQFTSNGTQLTSYQDLPNSPAAVTATTGACSPTFFGNTISVPNPLIITNPGVGQTVTPGAIVGIGPSGLLLESNNSYGAEAANSQSSAPYQPFLGAGTGAMGLPQPSASIDTSALMSAQYAGVIYGGGTTGTDWTSLIASFGFSSMPSSCPSGIFTTPIYGGDFADNNPGSSAAQANGGFGNCDTVLDLGAQDTSSNGLFPQATVTLYSGFGGNTTPLPHSFPATAIVGQLQGKYAIFLIGVDTSATPNQAWGIYLFQSN